MIFNIQNITKILSLFGNRVSKTEVCNMNFNESIPIARVLTLPMQRKELLWWKKPLLLRYLILTT